MKATGSPTWRTRSTASARRGGTISGYTAARQGIGPRPAEIGGGVDAVHAGAVPLRGGRVDPLDQRMGVRRAQDMAPQRTGTVDVGEVAAAAGQEAEVLEALDGSADVRAHAPFSCALAGPCHVRRRQTGGVPSLSGNLVDRHVARHAAHRALLGRRLQSAGAAGSRRPRDDGRPAPSSGSSACRQGPARATAMFTVWPK